MNTYNKDYELYMKSITDTFAKICNYEGVEGLLVGDGFVPVTFYKFKEYLLEFDQDMKELIRNYGVTNEIYQREFLEKRTKIALQFLNENTLTFDQWKQKHIQ